VHWSASFIHPKLPFLHDLTNWSGYFTERAEELAVKVDVTKTNMILTAVVGALVGQPDGVRLAALSAMNHILPFAKNNFAVQGERDFIIQRLHDCAVPAFQVPPPVPPGAVSAHPNSASIRESALECCARIIELYYDKIDHNFVVAIYNITTAALDLKTNTPDEVMLQAINFWSTLAQVEYHYEDAAEAGDVSVVSKKLALAASGNLLPLLLTCLHGEGRDYREDDPNAEDENTSPYTAAAECIGHFASLLKSDILPLVTPFLANLRSKDWKAREAALFAFAQIMEGPVESSDPAKDIATVISHYLQPGICPLLLDESSHAVRHSAAFALGRAVKFFPHVVLRVYETPDKFYLSMVQMLDPVRLSAKDPRTVEFYLWSLREMVLAVNEKYPEQHILPGSEIIFEALLVTADRPDSSQSELRSLSFEVLCDFIRCSSIPMLPHIMRHLINNIMQRLFAVLNAPLSSQSDATTRSVVAAKLVSVFGSIFTRFSLTPSATSELAAFLKTIMHNQLSMADNAVTFFLQALPADAELEGGSMCAEEVVMAAAQMSKIVSADFEKYLAALNPKFLVFMRSVRAGDLAFITCTSLGDIVRSIGPPITRSTQALLEWLYYAGQLVANPESDANYGVTSFNSVRSIAINLISDIVMEIGAQINDQYREQIMAALSHAHGHVQKLLAQMSQQQFEDDDIEYTKNLISDVLGLWMALSQAHHASQQAQSGAGQVFAQYVPQVLACITFADQFAQWLAADDSRGDPAFILGSCANLLTDVARCLGPAVTVQLRGTPVVTEVLQVS
jgi:importin subunit beta-1